MNTSESAQTSSAYRRYSVALLVVLLMLCVGVVVAAQWTNRRIEAYLIELMGRGLTQSAAGLAESLNRVLFEHALQSQTIAQAPVLRRPDAETLTAYIRGLRASLPDYMELEIIDVSGRVIGATDTKQIGADAGGQAWYQMLSQGGVRNLRGQDLFEQSGRTMLFPSPIVGEEGQFLGAVVLQIGLQSVEFILDGVRRSPALRPPAARAEYQLVGGDGTVLYDSTDRERKTGRRARIGNTTWNGATKPGYREEIHPERHAPVVVGYAPVNRYGQVPGWQWTLLIRMDRDAVLTPYYRLVATAMLWGGIALIGFTVALLWIIGRLKRASEPVDTGTVSPVTAVQTAKPTPPPVSVKGRASGVRSVSAVHDAPTAVVPEPPALDPAQWEDLRRWVRLAEVNRVSLFKNHRGEDGELWASRCYEWIGLGEVARTEWSQWFSWSFRAKGFSRWEQTLARREAISGAVASFPEAEAAALSSCGIRTVYVMPLFLKDEWWGFVEFDHCFTDRVWSEPEQQGLQGAVNLLQAVIERGAGEAFLQRVLAVIDAALESTADGLLVVDREGNLVNFNQRLVSMWNMPDAVTESRLTEEIMGWMMRQLKEPDVLLRTMSELGSEPEAESYDILELQDGRMVERLSRPRREGDRCDGRIWIFRESIALRPSPLSVHSSQ